LQTDWRLSYRRYVKRAAFLLLAVHPIINLASYYFIVAGKSHSSGFQTFIYIFLFNFPMTDTIAACLLISPVFIIRFSHFQRTMAIVSILVCTAAVRAYVTSANPNLAILQEAIFGGLGDPKIFWFPLAPWLAIFLTGSFVGSALACHKKETLDISELVRGMKKAGILLAICCVVMTIGYKMLKMAFGSVWCLNLFLAISPGQTTTLLPGYLAVLALLLAALVNLIDISRYYNLLFWLLSVLGRTSLFAFVVQFAVIESVPAILGLKGALTLTGFFILFCSGLGAVWILAYLYGRLRNWIAVNDYAECVNTARARSQST
jgi:hypothetical protein